MYYKKILVSIFFLLLPQIVAAENTHMDNQVKVFVRSIIDQDEPMIKVSWETIHKNVNIQHYMADKYPWATYAYQRLKVSFKLLDYLKHYRANYPRGSVHGGGGEEKSFVIQPRKAINNNSTTKLFPNHLQKNLRIEWEAAVKRSLKSNQTVARAFPNQRQIPNQLYFARRLERNKQYSHMTLYLY